MRTPAELAEDFRARGLKITPQRELLFGLVHGDDAHPTAEAIHAAALRTMPTLSLKTVYQTLNDLAQLGELRQLDLGTGSSRFDPNVDDHQHLVCTSCGKVRDVSVAVGDLELSDEDRQGFRLGGADVVFRGLCAECQGIRIP